MSNDDSFFPELSPRIDLVEKEHELLEWWYESGVVERYLHKNDDAEERFRFLDGPITANNPMGVHHAHGRAFKDFFQRYKNMQGFKQRFQNGFDCQGLWVEVEEEKDRGFNSKREIEEFGLTKFSRACRARVEKYADIQTEQSKRLGIFMDWDNSYYTMSETNNLVIWHFLKRCHELGWLYKGTDVMPWCVRCGTVISQHELSDGGYREVTHLSLYVRFPLEDEQASLVVWTTTPWTLPANVAVAVDPDAQYLVVEHEGERFIVGATRAETVFGDEFEIVGERRGEDLVGAAYQGPFDELKKLSGIEHRVIGWDEVSGEEGSGLVHIAPGAGKEDYQLAQKHDLSLVTVLDEFGNYESGYGSLSGMSVRDASETIIQQLRQASALVKQESYTHNYPVCWRCKEELVFRTTSEWFISVEEIRERMITASAGVNWMPDHARKRMRDWLENMGDWPISRKRYWGLALPFYECECGEVIVVGSKEELKELAVEPAAVDELPELHRPWIDEITIACPSCDRDVERVQDVGDCWLDAGIVPFSTVKYLEDRDYWAEWFPFDLITEYIAQVKLWFYATLFMAVALEDEAPWQNVLATGFIVDEQGDPMHKSAGNAIWFDDAIDEMGADVMRWTYLSRDPFGDVRFGFTIGEEVRRRFIMILWNTLVFFTKFANLDDWNPTEKPSVLDNELELTALDSWILSRLHSTIETVTSGCEVYDAATGAQALDELVQDLSTWYLRRSRSRVGPRAQNSGDTEAFHATMHHVYTMLSRLLAPYMPYLSELIYGHVRLPGDPESVHLCDWPTGEKRFIDTSLERQMRIVREAVALGHAARHEAGIKVRQPLQSAVIAVADGDTVTDEALLELVKVELNIKSMTLKDGDDRAELDTTITEPLQQEGEARELFRKLQSLRKKHQCDRDERLKKVIVPAGNLDETWRIWLKENILADELEFDDSLSIERYD